MATINVEVGAWVRYTSTRIGEPAAAFEARYRPTGPRSHPQPGTLDCFLTERYCLYTLDESFHLHRLDIHHLPWPLQPAEAEITANRMAEASGIRAPRAFVPRISNLESRI